MTNKARILEFLYKNPNNEYNVNQLSRLLGISVGSAFKILKEFEKNTYVNIKRKNNALLYKIIPTEKTRKAFDVIENEKNSKIKHKTKVMCTIGESSNVIIKRLMEKGMDVARIDASRHNQEAVLSIVENIRQASDYIPILLDIPGKDISKPWIRFAVKNNLDFVSVSYVRNANEIETLYGHLGYSSMKEVIGGKIKLFVKFSQHTLRNYKEIIEEVYGIILDRDLLITDSNYEALPRIQKSIVAECNRHAKPAIIGSQLLESMRENRFPSKAEVYDIANAILDKVSCLMLSEEIESGKYPIEATETITNIIKNVEIDHVAYGKTKEYIGNPIFEEPRNIDAFLIITSGGYTARIVSSKRPRCKIIAATSSKKIFRQLKILWGVEPLFVDTNLEDISNYEKEEVLLKALKKGFIKKTDLIAVMASVFHSRAKRANLLEIHRVNEFLDYLHEKGKIKQNGLFP